MQFPRFNWLKRRRATVCDEPSLAAFIDGNSAYVAQITLYGYLKTRAGFKYFRLFDDDCFVKSVNIAKWNIYAVCVGDLAVFCAAHLRRYGNDGERLSGLINRCVERAFVAHESPADAGTDYARLCEETRQHVRGMPWRQEEADNERAFVRSVAALAHWAPVADAHKKHDEEVVKNSIEFKWKEVRDKFRRNADVAKLTRLIGDD